MVKLSATEKKETFGGIGPMMLWVGITGVCLLISAISQLFSNSGQKSGNTPTSYNPESYSSNTYHSSSKSSAFMRVSPMLKSSAFYLPI